MIQHFTKHLAIKGKSVAEAVTHTMKWAVDNMMLLNANKTVIMNVYFNGRTNYDETIFVDDSVSVQPSTDTKFLGIHIDKHLTFSNHVDSIVSSCNSRLFLLRQLKLLAMNREGLKRYCCANIRSLITHASPAWFLFYLIKTGID